MFIQKKRPDSLIFAIVLVLCFIAVQSFAQNYGDVNDDGNITIIDALLTAQYSSGLTVKNFNSAAADVNRDITISIVDALLIARYAAGLITFLPFLTPTPTKASPTSSATPSPSPSQTPIVMPPVFNPPGAVYLEPQNITLTTETAGATIYYAIDGYAYTTSGIIYTSPIHIPDNTTIFINALASKEGWKTATSITARYTISASAQVARWVRTSVSEGSGAYLQSLAVDDSGNIYGAGTIRGTGRCNFGNNVTAMGPGIDSKSNALLVKFDPNGLAQWARVIQTSNDPNNESSDFKKLAVDGAGNIFVIGTIPQTGTSDFGNNVRLTTTQGNVFAKYNTNGLALWAKAVATSASTATTALVSLALDSNGNIYTAGSVSGTGLCDFGNGVSITNPQYTSIMKMLLVKYDGNGIALWCKSLYGTNSDSSSFRDVAVDGNGTVYAAGVIGDFTFDFGDGITITTTYGYSHAALVCYNANGTTRWAKSVVPSAASNPQGPTYSYNSYFNSVAVDGIGNVYTAGVITLTGSYDFGDKCTVTPPYTQATDYYWTPSNRDCVIVKYTSDGITKGASTASSYPSYPWAEFYSVAADTVGNVFASGYVQTARNYRFYTGDVYTEIDTVSPGDNPILVKYDSAMKPVWARTLAAGPGGNVRYNCITADKNGNIFAGTSLYASGSYNFGNNVAVTGGGSCALVKYR